MLRGHLQSTKIFYESLVIVSLTSLNNTLLSTCYLPRPSLSSFALQKPRNQYYNMSLYSIGKETET